MACAWLDDRRCSASFNEFERIWCEHGVPQTSSVRLTGWFYHLVHGNFNQYAGAVTSRANLMDGLCVLNSGALIEILQGPKELDWGLGVLYCQIKPLSQDNFNYLAPYITMSRNH